MVRTMMFAALVFVGVSSAADAQLYFHTPKETPPPGRPRTIEHTQSRAGNPMIVSPHAKPTNTGAYTSYYIGGGSPCLGGGPGPDEGTWGQDYRGCLIPRNVWLGWSHGRRYQGGTGAYATDGPIGLHGNGTEGKGQR